jgi:Gpi18-like mannosyltransferase
MARRYLPEARSQLLAVAAALMAAFYTVLAVTFALGVMQRPVGIVLAPLFALLAWGIWKLSRFARWVTIIWVWIMVLVMPLSLVGPMPQDAPHWGTLLAAVTPFVVAGLFFIYVFGKHKREFKWP